MRPEYYADNFRRYNTFVKNYSGNRVERIACGSNGTDYNWTDVLMNLGGTRMQGLSLHWYTLPTGNWRDKGSSTKFEEDQWHSTMVQALRMEELVTRHAAIMEKYDPQKRVGMVVDEWGTWYNVEPGTNPGFLHQQNTLRDAIVAGMTLNIFNRHCDRITMANIAQTINVLQAMILTDQGQMLVTPTYHVFEMYKVHQNATLIPVEMNAPEYKFGEAAVPSVHVSASRDTPGKLHVSLVNLDPNRAAQLSAKLSGSSGKGVTGRILTAPAMNTHNTFESGEQVKPADFKGATITGDELKITLPSKSVVVLEIE
jgi:alpha-N-arabinofuranosidase